MDLNYILKRLVKINHSTATRIVRRKAYQNLVNSSQGIIPKARIDEYDEIIRKNRIKSEIYKITEPWSLENKLVDLYLNDMARTNKSSQELLEDLAKIYPTIVPSEY